MLGKTPPPPPPFPPAVLLADVASGNGGFAVLGIAAYDQSGYSVASAGDVNNDTIDDIILGAPQAGIVTEYNRGESYVVFGATGIGAGGLFDLMSLNGYNGFLIAGIDSNDFSGSSVANAGDVNGDGIDDVVIGAPGGDPNGVQSGETYVVFGVSCDCGVGPPAVPLFSLWSQLALLGSMLVGGVWVASADSARLRRRRARASPPP